MTMKFLLHENKKINESSPNIHAHLSLPYIKANVSQSQKSHQYCLRTNDRVYINESSIFFSIFAIL